MLVNEDLVVAPADQEPAIRILQMLRFLTRLVRRGIGPRRLQLSSSKMQSSALRAACQAHEELYLFYKTFARSGFVDALLKVYWKQAVAGRS